MKLEGWPCCVKTMREKKFYFKKKKSHALKRLLERMRQLIGLSNICNFPYPDKRLNRRHRRKQWKAMDGTNCQGTAPSPASNRG